jgi:hypothetical protein
MCRFIGALVGGEYEDAFMHRSSAAELATGADRVPAALTGTLIAAASYTRRIFGRNASILRDGRLLTEAANNV